MNNEFQMRLDFLVNFVADQNKIKAIADKANELLKKIKPPTRASNPAPLEGHPAQTR